MFIDEVFLKVKAGNGGNGAVMFYPMKKGPCGGMGGDGGSVFVRGDKQLADLHMYAGHLLFKAPDGKAGQRFRKSGTNGEDLVLKMPIGTVLKEVESGLSFEIVNDTDGILLACGGRGGRGNMSFATATNQTPKQAEKGSEGEHKSYEVILKLIANYGLVGLPNAGKSSLLNELTNAKVKTAMYAFTTLEPNLGVLQNIIIADIPGLIEGASDGKGLGFKFLKHIEKVQFLLHCVSSDSKDINYDLEVVNRELSSYNPDLVKKPKIILLTKTDLISNNEIDSKLKMLKKKYHYVLPISVYNPIQFQVLKDFLIKLH